MEKPQMSDLRASRTRKVETAQLCLTLCDPMDVAFRLLCPWDFSGKGTGVGLPFPSLGDLPDPGIEPGSPALQADSLLSEPPGNRKCLV